VDYSSLVKTYFNVKESFRQSQADLERALTYINQLEYALSIGEASVALLDKDLELLMASPTLERTLGGREMINRALEKLRWKISQAESLCRPVSFDLSLEDAEGKKLTLQGVVTPLGSLVDMTGFHIQFGQVPASRLVLSSAASADDKRMVDAIHSLQAAFILDTPAGELFKNMLDHLLLLTGSQFGFVGRVLRLPDGKPYLKTHAISDISWNEVTRNLFLKISTEGMEFRNLNTLFGHTLRTGEWVIANNPKTDKRSGGLPEGHPPLDSFMGVPFYLGGVMVGMAGLANRPGGYNQAMAAQYQPLFSTCASLIDAYENKERRRQAEEGLVLAKIMAEKATAEKDKYISLIAHDLKSPFTSIIAFLKLLGKGKVSLLDPDNRPLFDSIIESSERATRMIDEVLALSRLGMGAVKMEPKFIDARAAAMSAISLLGHVARAKEISIANDVPSGSRIRVDPTLFSEVLTNLLSNAIKFTPRGGKVVFYIPGAQPTTVAVKDNGVGIEEKTVPLIFRHDVKTSADGTEGEKGTGLALPICREIMRVHHGDLTVESVPGKGSVFYARLPKSQPLVMVVDDERLARVGIRKMLERMDVEVAEAANASEAISRLVNRRPDLVCLDLRMPGGDGFKVIEAIKGSKDTMAIPVLVVTSDKSLQAREKAIRLGADDFITKEQLDDELLLRVRKFLI